MKGKNIAIACDHKGFRLKEFLKNELIMLGFSVQDFGTVNDSKSVDYPDYASLVVQAIEKNNEMFGILICGSGIGMSIAANRSKYIRAALCHDDKSAELARKHNNANVLVLGSNDLSHEVAKNCVKIFLNAEFEGGRHVGRVSKISN